MFLSLARTRLTVYKYTEALTLECYHITRHFPADERFVMVQQIRRAVLSVHLNLAEGASRKFMVERRHFFEISRGSVIEVDTAVHVATALNYISIDETKELGELTTNTFRLLTGMISQPSEQ